MKIPVSFRTAYARADKSILVDSGATDNFIHPRFIRRLALGTQKLECPRKIWNIDGTNNKAGRIAEYVDLSVQTGKKQNKMRFLVTDLGHEDLILGYPWLAMFEPRFSWADGTIDTEHLPVIVKSLNWETRLTKTTISRVATEQMPAQEKEQIVKELEDVTIRTYRPIFIYFTRCTDTGVTVTHALSFYRPLAPLFLMTLAQLTVVTQSCALLYATAHCDLLLQ